MLNEGAGRHQVRKLQRTSNQPKISELPEESEIAISGLELKALKTSVGGLQTVTIRLGTI